MTQQEETGEFQILYDGAGRLVLVDASGVRHENVQPVRAFPLSQRNGWIAICDAKGNELALIEAIADLSRESRAAVERSLAQREFMPVIRRIRERDLHALPTEWDVETDRGPTRLELKSEDDVRSIGEKQVLIIDARGVRFLVADISALDTASRHALERHL